MVAAPASANGAMGMALATFEWPLWLTYVAVTVILEAVLFGVWLRVTPMRALGLAIAANALTGLIGGYLSGIPSYAFQGAFGSSTNPNPFGRILLLFALSALISAWLESKVWFAGVRNLDRPPSPGGLSAVSLAIHLLTLPVGLAILLSPDRPYPGLVGQTWYYRKINFERPVAEALQSYLSAHTTLPRAADGEAFIRALAKEPPLRDLPDAWLVAYRPDQARFDTREMRRKPLEWNAANRFHREKSESPVWVLRFRTEGDWARGLVVYPGGEARWTQDREELGYPTRVASPKKSEVSRSTHL